MFNWLAMLLIAMSAPDASAPLTPLHLYNGIRRPVPIEVSAPAGVSDGLSMIILGHDGAVLGGPAQVDPGRVDLAELIPSIWLLRRAAFLQLQVGDDPHGAPLILQPMLSRMLPITQEAENPSGIRYTRIIGWHDEQNPPPAPPAPPPPADQEGEQPEDQAPAEAPPPPVKLEPLITGLRIYVDQDVVLQTDHGDIVLAMRPDAAPNTAFNFLQLCAGGFYRDVIFHRIVPLARNGDPFVIQAGDPTGSGSGGPGFWLPIEPSELPHDFGVISMARDVDPDSAGSQFFICLSRPGTARLDGHYCAFGYAVDGAETIKAIADIELADVEHGRPVDPPMILSARLVPAPPRTPGRGRPDERVTAQSAVPEEPQRQPR
jgi:peptidyl-prolyl cis-trans isomerase B (cyclophilin B)